MPASSGRFPARAAAAALLGLSALLAVAFVLVPRHDPAPTAAAPAPAASDPDARDLVIEFPKSWNEIPGKLSRTYRSPRPGAGLVQLSVHPPLPAGTTAVGAEKELTALLQEMVSEMDFGRRIEIRHASTPAGPLAFARYQSPKHGMLGFWLLAAEPMIFATYVDGGPGTAEKDIAEADRSFLEAHYARP